MDPIEKAIRSAFEKGSAEDRAFREKVYRSAFAALDKAIKANPAMTVEAAIRRRKALQAKVAEIESEFLPAVGAPTVEPEQPAPPMQAPQAAAPGRPPSVEPPPARPVDRPAARREPSIAADDPVLSGPVPVVAPDGEYPAAAARARGPAVDPDRNEARARPRRRPYVLVFVMATLVAAAGIGAWWASQTGLFLSQAERDTSVPNPPQTSEPEDFVPEQEAAPNQAGTADPNRNWIGIFSPADPSSVTAAGGSTAQVMQDGGGPFLRIVSGAAGATVLFDVGQGVLEQLAGKSATFDIVARGAEGQQTEMAVDCNFGDLGDCGRKRYAVSFEKADYLFEVAFPNENPGAEGTIAVNSDFSGSGKAVDIYEIRVSVSE